MTIEEARKVARVLSECDGNCSVCVKKLINIIQKEFPEFIWKYNNDNDNIVVNQINDMRDLCKYGNEHNVNKFHTCPYQVDINEDKAHECQCCQECIQDCNDAI